MRRIYNYYSEIIVREVPKSTLGYRVLGRAIFGVGRKIVEIAKELKGYLKFEVLTHELMHLKYPNLSEYEIRIKTRLRLLELGINPKLH